jgi:hypothetical protein
VCADNSTGAGATDLTAGNAEEGAAPATGFAAAAAAAVADAGAIGPAFVAPGGARFPDVAAGFGSAGSPSAPLPLRTDGEPAPCPPALKRPAASVHPPLSNQPPEVPAVAVSGERPSRPIGTAPAGPVRGGIAIAAERSTA